MRAIVQRVSKASVEVDQCLISKIGHGLLVLLGVAATDTELDAVYLADKIVGLRVFDDDNGKMNLSVQDTGGSILVVSQFTLLGDARKGRRPSFIAAAEPELGNQLYERFAMELASRGVDTHKGKFKAMMEIELVNQGPVTILLDSQKEF